jgi:hypothetical protein
MTVLTTLILLATTQIVLADVKIETKIKITNAVKGKIDICKDAHQPCGPGEMPPVHQKNVFIDGEASTLEELKKKLENNVVKELVVVIYEEAKNKGEAHVIKEIRATSSKK